VTRPVARVVHADERERIDALRQSWRLAVVSVRRAGPEAWAAPSGRDGWALGAVARHLAAVFDDVVSGSRRSTDERLAATDGWDPDQVAGDVQGRAATIVAYLRQVPEERWAEPRSDGLTLDESLDRLAFVTWVHLDHLGPLLEAGARIDCEPWAARWAVDELAERGVDVTGRDAPDLIRTAWSLVAAPQA
jgi:hypothetical protein